MARAGVYNVIRKTHLCAGLVLLVFVVMYFVAGYPITHNQWFDAQDPVKTERTVAIPSIEADDIREYSAHLQEHLEIRGKRTTAREWHFEYFRPGIFHEVDLVANGDSARVVTQRFGWQRTMVGFHRMHNYGGGGIYELWVLFYDVASLSLILFALTGIYL
ncbi:MAG: PepSY-associated TM helix domain-containing protein [Candidatus Latescibacterota bacterium]|nr:PepSY-associated TM helix domain-containing protein [Candidatus Latescibacterota bacterium]